MRALVPVLLVTLAPTAHAQLFQRLFNPDVQVELTHPPALGLKVSRVAFAPSDNDATEDFVSACISELMAMGGIDIVDRTATSKLLTEQKFSNSGLVDGDMAVEMGRVLGSPVLLLITVHAMKVKPDRAHKEREHKDKEGKITITHTYISRTQVDFVASVQAIDTATGKIYSARRIVLDPQRENTSRDGYPEYPSESDVKEEAIRQARTEVVRLLLPWKERRKLIFYDDKDYGMKEAYRALDAKDYPEALRRSQEALAKAKADPKAGSKYLGRTHYNVGMCHFILGDYDAALPALRAARTTDTDNGIFRESVQELEKAQALRQEMARVETRSVGFQKGGGTPPPPTSSTPPPATGKATLEERLERLNGLYKKGLIDEKEYQARKAELLKEL